MTSRSDFDCYGFRASEIYDFLDRKGITLARPGASSLTGQKAAANIPDWMLPLRAMPVFAVWEAACIMANDDPHPPDYGGYQDSDPDIAADIARYRRLLLAAIDADDLPGGNWSQDPTRQEVPHAALRDWCERNDQPWPIPSLTPRPATSAEALTEIERLKAEVERYKAELQEAKDGVVHADHPQCPSELDACMTIWRRATKCWQPGKTPKSAVEDAIAELYPDAKGKVFERYSAVCNWDKTPGRKAAQAK